MSNLLLFISNNKNRILLWISSIFFTTILTVRKGWFSIIWFVVGIIVSSLTSAYLLFKEKIWFDELNIAEIPICLVGSCIWMQCQAFFWYQEYSQKINSIIGKAIVSGDNYAIVITVFFAICAFYSAFFIITKIYKFCIRTISYFLTIIDFTDKMYLLLWIFINSIILFCIYSRTSVFFSPGTYNIIYTFDSDIIYKQNCFLLFGQGENDIRQSLFALFSLPIAILSKLLSYIICYDYSYAFFLQLFQDLLIPISIILIIKMMNIDGKRKIYSYLFMSSMVSVILFALMIEQYIVLCFWLIVSIYCIVNNVGNMELFAVASVGTSPMNAIALIWEITNKKNIYEFLRYTLISFIKYVSSLVYFGQIGIITGLYNNVNKLLRYTKKVAFSDKIYQYIYFIRSCFIGPESYISSISNDGSYMSIKMDNIAFISVVGVAILLMFIFSIFNKKISSLKSVFLGLLSLLLFY